MTNNRKDDHANLALDQQREAKPSIFDDIRFIHHSFSRANFQEIDLSTEWGGTVHNWPFHINGMTGGSEYTRQFNDKLSILARETGLAMASGSISAAIKDPSVSETFTIIRKNNPKGFVMANLGAHHTVENAKKAVDLLQADGLQIHLNVPQEVVMPEGDRDYAMWEDHIAQMVEEVGVPIIVKEVGFGMSGETISRLIELGVKTVDISGRGGTNFIRIENDRRSQLDFSSIGYWGQTTPESLLESLPYQDQVGILASGGVRDYYDIFRALALGARAVGLSGRMLSLVHEQGVDAGIELIESWKEILRHLMLMVDAETIADLGKKQIIIQGELREYAEARGIDYQGLARR